MNEKSPCSPPFLPSSSSSSSTDGAQPGRFTLPSLRASDGSGSAVHGSKNTGSFFFSPLLPHSIHPRLDYRLSVIFPVTLTSSVVAAAKKLTLSKKGKWPDRNLCGYIQMVAFKLKKFTISEQMNVIFWRKCQEVIWSDFQKLLKQLSSHTWASGNTNPQR